MKKGFKFGAMSLAALLVFGAAGCGKVSDADGKAWAEANGYVKAPGALPAPRDASKTVTKKVSGVDTEFSCDTDDTSISYDVGCSTINSENLKNYLNRSDVAYIDVRNTRDSGKYDELHLKGFVNYEFFADIYGGSTAEEGTQLFYRLADGTFVPRYASSVSALEAMFPKDKTLFLMCQSGARVATLMALLDQYGWDMEKVYNVGGMGQYTVQAGYGDLRVEVTNDYLYTVKTGTATGSVGSTALDVTVNVLWDSEEKIVGGVYITDGTISSTSWAENVTEGLSTFLKSFEGLTVDEVRAMVSNGELAGDVDAIASATVTSKLIVDAVINALSDITE